MTALTDNDRGSKAQIDKFKEAARELETDDSEERFAQVLKKIAKSPAKPAEGEKTKE
jgi:hypothetical protein